SVPASITHIADDLDSAGGGTSNPAGNAFGAPVSDSTVPTPAAMDSAGSHHESGVSVTPQKIRQMQRNTTWGATS
ncbi:hypothetical protein Tco_0175749, partial [Tanacetum coccineum]